MLRSSSADGASLRSRETSLKISVSDAPVTLVVTSAVSRQFALASRVYTNEFGE